MKQRRQPGYYAGFESLSQQRFWDAATRDVVVRRVEEPTPIAYFGASDVAFWQMVFDHLVPQDDREFERRIPLVNALDARLAANRSQGYRFSNMPPDREAYRLGRVAIDAEAHVRGDAPFVELSYGLREATLCAIHDGTPAGAQEIWRDMSVHRFWQMMLGDAIDAYYAHPWAWDEIGFGGPSYPRAYARLERGQPETWEVDERRYEWAPPSEARSAIVDDVSDVHRESEQHRANRRAR